MRKLLLLLCFFGLFQIEAQESRSSKIKNNIKYAAKLGINAWMASGIISAYELLINNPNKIDEEVARLVSGFGMIYPFFKIGDNIIDLLKKNENNQILEIKETSKKLNLLNLTGQTLLATSALYAFGFNLQNYFERLGRSEKTIFKLFLTSGNAVAQIYSLYHITKTMIATGKVLVKKRNIQKMDNL